MDIGEKIKDYIKDSATDAIVGEVKGKAMEFANKVAVDPAISSAAKSIGDQINIDKIKTDVKEKLNIDPAIDGLIKGLNTGDINKSLGIDEINKDIKNINTGDITSSLDIDDIFSGIDFSELEAQGVDTSEIKKMVSEAKTEIGNINIDTQTLDVKTLGLDINMETLKGLSSNDIKEKIKSVTEIVKEAKGNIDVKKTFSDVTSSVKTQLPTNVNSTINEMKAQANSSISSFQANVKSMTSGLSGFGGFRR